MSQDIDIDFSVIGEVESSRTATTIQVAELVGLEITSLDQGKSEFEQERLKHDVEKGRMQIALLRAEVANIHQGIDLRSTFSGQILRYLWIFSGFCGLIILADGSHLVGFHLDTAVLTTLVGGTAASAFGLVSVVLGGLFKNSEGKNSDAGRRRPKGSPKKARADR